MKFYLKLENYYKFWLHIFLYLIATFYYVWFFMLFRTLISLLFFLRDDSEFLWLSETVKPNWDKSDQTNKQH